MVAKDLFIAWRVSSAEGYSLLNVPQSFRVPPGLEFAQTAQCESRACAGNHLDIVRKSIPCRDIVPGSVMQRTQEPPPIRPFGVDLHGPRIEFNRTRDVVLHSRCGGLRNQIVPPVRRALARCLREPRTRQERRDQNNADTALP